MIFENEVPGVAILGGCGFEQFFGLQVLELPDDSRLQSKMISSSGCQHLSLAIPYQRSARLTRNIDSCMFRAQHVCTQSL